MTDPANYELQPSGTNRSAGAKLGADMHGQGLSYSETHPEPIDSANFEEEAAKLRK